MECARRGPIVDIELCGSDLLTACAGAGSTGVAMSVLVSEQSGWERLSVQCVISVKVAVVFPQVPGGAHHFVGQGHCGLVVMASGRPNGVSILNSTSHAGSSATAVLPPAPSTERPSANPAQQPTQLRWAAVFQR